LEGHTFKDFERIAQREEEGDSAIDWDDDEEVYSKIETEYWDLVEH
jgi:hypothetical protein